MQNGKGDTPRPVTNRARFLKNWDDIFGKKVDIEDSYCNNPKTYENSTNSIRTEESGMEGKSGSSSKSS